MNNVFLTNVKIHYKYDLKGSLFQRISRDPKKNDYDDYDFNIPMKDLDLLDRKFKFKLNKEESTIIINQLQNDASFLAAKNINDYSFLIGIHEIGKFFIILDYNGKGITPNLPEMLNKFNRDTVNINKEIEQFNIEVRKPFFEKDRGGLISADGKIIYFIGIIDIFTEYGSKKKAENVFKSIFQGPDISCKPPIEYYERFYNFMKKIIDENSNIADYL